MSDSRLVYSTDPKLNRPCPKCKELEAACVCEKPDVKACPNFFAVLRIEKSGRGGKTVTVIDGLPKLEIRLKEWTKALKNRCGAGGTYKLDGKEGVIEIQGDKRDQVRTYFASQNIKTKG